MAREGPARPGLSEPEARRRAALAGPNQLPSPRSGRTWALLRRHLTNLFVLLLVAAAAMSFIAASVDPAHHGMRVLGWALLATGLLNVSFSFAQEHRAERAMDELARLLPRRALVRRDGVERSIDAVDLVPGDLIILRDGDRIPADGHVLVAEDLLVSLAPLTGEAKPVRIVASPEGAALPDGHDIVRAGCSVLQGSAEAVVVDIGTATAFGRTAMLSHSVQRPRTPLDREIRRMVRVLTLVPW